MELILQATIEMAMKIGFTHQILESIRDSEMQALNYESIITTLDDYIGELKKLFYA